MINSHMNYHKHYHALIFRAKNRILNDEYETHHVIPRCLGGTDNSENLVRLTPEEHYTAHLLLVKMHNDPKLIYAAQMMIVSSRYNRRNNKMYGWLKRRYSEICKQRLGEKNGSFGTIWITNGTNAKKIKRSDPIPIGYTEGRVIKKPQIRKSRKIKKIADSDAQALLDDYESGMPMSEILIKYNRKSEQSVTTFLRSRFPNRKTFLPKMRTKALKH